MKKSIAFALVLILTGCDDETSTTLSPAEKTGQPTETPRENQDQHQQEQAIQLTTTPSFSVRKPGRYIQDQLAFNFTKTVNASLVVRDSRGHEIFNSSANEATSEHTFNLGSTYNATSLDYGVYQYTFTASLADGSETRTIKGQFEKGLRPIHEFDHKISDISIDQDTLYVATGDYMRPIEVHTINTQDDTVHTLAIAGTELPKPIYDMHRFGDSIYFGGRKQDWLGGQLLTRYQLDTQTIEVLDNTFACQQQNQDECSAVFSLTSQGDTLYIGTSNGLYTYRNNSFTKVTQHGLKENTDIKSLFVDSLQRVWAGSMAEGGLTYLHQGIWHPMTEGNSTMPAGGIMAFAEGTDGEIYIANNINGLTRYQPDSGEVVQFTPYNSNIIDHNLVSVAYTDGIIVGSHDYGIAKSTNGTAWTMTDHTNSLMKQIKTDACEFDPDAAGCQKVLVVERIVDSQDGRVFAAIGKGVYELY
ncbi:hypothetical protein [Photobacterium atrarenae]|uniref:Uncharacterized protein n=1 Tax=Photobacterium atrarenae TaxID=865757 RepID=A0ABY5GDP1_9GAMM|nr:hypothetical protein [Photobacterium atrarenae]UTV27364.1 hypothetical protein NNL38_13700 [Photobacterium atrarenae]